MVPTLLEVYGGNTLRQSWLCHRCGPVCAGIGEDSKASPLFRAAIGKRKQLTNAAYAAHSIRQMMKRRLGDAGLPDLFSPHSFRVAVVTDLLNQNVPLEDVQYLAGHSSPTTTRVYDRRRRRITRNIVERISI